MRSPKRLFASIVVVLLAGCTHTQLRHNTLHQVRTLSDIHQQQVLNNLAMFVHDPGALPHFAFPNKGSTSVQDTGKGTFGLGFNRAGFNTAALGLDGTRFMVEGWELVPINDPRKLELMRCAYQQVVANCGIGDVSQSCPDCEARWNVFRTGHPKPAAPFANEVGIVDRTCLSWACWFCYGTKKDVPKDCDCMYVGHYCGVYVWVPPAGRGELAKLTLTILDYAIYEPLELPQPPPAPMARVVETRGPDGSVLKKEVTYEVPVDEAQRGAVRAEMDRLFRLQQEIAASKLSDEEKENRLRELDQRNRELRQALQTLNLQAASPRLDPVAPVRQRTPVPGGFSPLDVQLFQDAFLPRRSE